MTTPQGDGRDLVAALSAAESWWREAGVDWAFQDAPRDWLASPRLDEKPPARPGAQQAAKPAEPSHGIGGDPARWPRSLPEFAEWWLSEPSLGFPGERHRVLPRGPEQAAFMVIVAQPEAEDRGRLLSGPQGRLLAAILAALGSGDEQAYVASVVPAHVGLIDWAGLARGEMAAVLAHHVALARPRRLLVFGRDIASSLPGNALAQDSPSGMCLRHESGEVPLACVASLEGLLERPARKASLWRTLLDWTAG